MGRGVRILRLWGACGLSVIVGGRLLPRSLVFVLTLVLFVIGGRSADSSGGFLAHAHGKRPCPARRDAPPASAGVLGDQMRESHPAVLQPGFFRDSSRSTSIPRSSFSDSWWRLLAELSKPVYMTLLIPGGAKGLLSPPV